MILLILGGFQVRIFFQRLQKEFEIYRIEQKEIYEEKNNIGCEKCWYFKNRKKDTDEYMKEIKKLGETKNEGK